MTEDKITNQILAGSERGLKTYRFDEKHDENIPAQMWFQKSHEGLILFIVFYTQACRWSRCSGCNLPSLCSAKHIDFKAIMNQVSYVFRQPEVLEKRNEIRKVIISNNGSVLDEATFSTTALVYLVAKLNKYLDNLEVFCLETRPEYVDFVELEMLKRALSEGKTPTKLELAVGFEAYDETIRNKHFQKGLDFEKFEKFISLIAEFKYKIKCYFMQKPVSGMGDEEAIRDVWNGVDYLSKLSSKYGVQISMHLNPTYAAVGTELEKSFNSGEYSPPNLLDVARAVLYTEGKNIQMFIGLSDEGLAVKGGSFRKDGDERIVAELEEFNQTQDFSILRNLLENLLNQKN